MTKIKAPKPPKSPKPPKLKKSDKVSKPSKSIEVKVRLPLTRVTFMSIFLAGLLTFVGYAGYLGVSSVWKFTHPKFNVSLDVFRSLDYISKGLTIPALPTPLNVSSIAPTDEAKNRYLQSVSEYEEEFRLTYPNSRLLIISENELMGIGLAFCQAKSESVDGSGNFSRAEIVEAFQAKFVLRYPGIEGLGVYLDAVAQRSFDQLCGGN